MSSTQSQLAPGDRVLLVHYGEIGLKGKNRTRFEKMLGDHIRNALERRGVEDLDVLRLEGRFAVRVPDDDLDPARTTLERVPGIVNFSVARVVETEIEEMKRAGVEQARSASFDEFAVRTSRAYKEFPLNSREINEEVGQAIVDDLDRGVELDHPDWTCRLEVMRERTFVYGQKIRGVGGLPVGVSGRVLTLLSGGIDSPVAAYLMMKRGSPTGYLHFHSFPLTDRGSQEKVREMVDVLSDFQGNAPLFVVPFADCQQEIVAEAPSNYRILLYRRFMIRIAERIAERNNYGALVTGDNLGQVSSQTLSNMRSIGAAIDLPILRPLLGYDKNDIVDLARRIETYEISIQPHEDCCSYLMPQQPETASTPEQLEDAERNLNVDELVNEAVDQIETV